MPFLLIDRTTGTNIGSLTARGGLEAAFDGVTNQARLVCANGNGSHEWIGKTLASPKRFGKAVIYGSNDEGYLNNVNRSTTINIRGKQGTAPSSRTDGTIVGTVTFTDTADESAGREIKSTDGVTYWDHIFAEIIDNEGLSVKVVAELELYEFYPASCQVVFIS